MGEFLITEAGQFRRQHRVALGKFGDLAGVVAFDNGLNRLRAGVDRLLTEQSGAGAQRKAGQAPYWRQHRRSDPSLGQQTIESRQVHALLSFHFSEPRGHPGMGRRRAEDSALSAIDLDGGQFAGMIDPQDLGKPSR